LFCVALMSSPAAVGAAPSSNYKTECRRVAQSAGLMAHVIYQACGSYTEYQNACRTQIYRRGIPDLVRADNYVNCLCGQAKLALKNDANELCHASVSIHGLLDEP